MKSFLRLAFAVLSLSIAGSALADPSIVRLVVHKKLTPQKESGPLPPAVLEQLSSGGYSLLADYEGMAVFKGPSAAVPRLLSTIQSGGRDAELASDLERFNYHDATMDAGAGPFSVGPAGKLYFLTLQTYTKYAWLQELSNRGVRVLQALPPAAFVVRADPAAALRLVPELPWVRGVFPLPASIKAIGFDRPPDQPGPFRDVVIRVSEESPAESLRPLLESLSGGPVSAGPPQPGQATYFASLTDLDVRNLTQIDRLFEIAPAGHASISSERQGQLIAGNGSTLLSSNSYTYLTWLSDHGFGIGANTFSNTTVGMIDTGFDNGDISYTGIHPDFKYFNGGNQTIVTSQVTPWSFNEDRDYHGTLTASVVGGYPPSSRADAAGYLYGLGVAPTVRIVEDKYFNCGSEGEAFSDTITRITAAGVNVINSSLNDGSTGCQYSTAKSAQVDSSTLNGYLYTLAVGNSPQGCTGNYVRSPATAKNGISVGSTDNYTLNWSNSLTGDTCAWCDYAPDHSVSQDARRIPSFSAVWDPSSLVKPDLVAPGTRVTGPVDRSSNICGGASSILCNSSVASPDSVTYAMSAGTSFAAPAVAGGAALVRKWYNTNTSSNPSPAMTKAILINGALDISGVAVRDGGYNAVATVGHIPDTYQGWGMLSFARLFGTWSNYYFYDQGTSLINSGDQWSQTVYIRDGSKQVQFTLAWSDPVGSQSTHYTTINDLNLLVIGGSPAVNYQGNYFNASGETQQRPPGALSRDSTNNVERVIIPAGKFSTGTALTVYVKAFSISSTQTFALAVENAGL